MATIVSGNHLGLDLTSLKTPGQSSGIPLRAGSGAQRYVNVFNGNLILQERDDFLAARGGNVEALRTYNSQGGYLDDNADNWSTGLYRRQLTLSGTAGQARQHPHPAPARRRPGALHLGCGAVLLPQHRRRRRLPPHPPR